MPNSFKMTFIVLEVCMTIRDIIGPISLEPSLYNKHGINFRHPMLHARTAGNFGQKWPKIQNQSVQFSNEKLAPMQLTKSSKMVVQDPVVPKNIVKNQNIDQNQVANEADEAVNEEQKNQMSLTEYLDKLFAHYSQVNEGHVPPTTIAKIMLRIVNEMKHRILRQNGRWEHRCLVTLDNLFVQKADQNMDGMDGNVLIRFDQKCNIQRQADLRPKHLLLMSPEQIQEMRLNTVESDIVWVFGCILHLMIFQKLPLEEWEQKKLLDNKYTDLLTESQRQQQQPQDDFERLYIADLREQVQKLLESRENIPIRDEAPSLGFQKHYAILFNMLKHSLQTFPENRNYVDGSLLKLAAGLVSWS